MMMLKAIVVFSPLVSSSLLLVNANRAAFVPAALRPAAAGAYVRNDGVVKRMASVETPPTKTAFDQEQYIAESREMRLKHLEEQAMFALKIACENYGRWGDFCSWWWCCCCDTTFFGFDFFRAATLVAR